MEINNIAQRCTIDNANHLETLPIKVRFIRELKSLSKMTGYNVQNRKVILGGKYERIF